MFKASLYTVIRIRSFVKWEYVDSCGRGAFLRGVLRNFGKRSEMVCPLNIKEHRVIPQSVFPSCR